MEKVEGKCMNRVKAKTLKRGAGNAILENIFKVESYIYNAGVWHNDMAPRNIFFTWKFGEARDYTNATIKFVDFNQSVVFSQDDEDYSIDPWLRRMHQAYPKKLVSPLPYLWDEQGAVDLCTGGGGYQIITRRLSNG
jgi:RIO-like serine/threonine protein kinase